MTKNGDDKHGEGAAMGISERKMKEAETKSCQTILSCFRWFSEVCDVVGEEIDGNIS